MTAIALRNFRGQAPRYSDRSLGPTQATAARNCRLTSGRLDPLRGLYLRHSTVASSLQTIYRYRFDGVDNWLTWADRVHVAVSPVAEDAYGRFYFTGAGEPRMSTHAAAISGSFDYPAAWFVLGVVAPAAAPTCTPSGGSGSNEDRSYCYTFRATLGEESGPSPSVAATGKADGTWTLGSIATAPPNSGTVSGAAASTPTVGKVRVTVDSSVGLVAGERITFASVGGMTSLNTTLEIDAVPDATHVDVLLTTAQTYTSGGTWTRAAPHNVTGMTKRIYRTVAGEFRFVAEIPVATTSYADTIASTVVAQNAALDADVLPPPKTLRNIAVLANGALVGIAGNQLCFSETDKPHSWPLVNRYAFAGEGVALSVVGNSVILLTDTYPIVYTATVPEAAAPATIKVYAPCYSEMGVVDADGGCLYPSYDGLYLATPGGARNLTDGLYRVREWEALYPRTFKAAFHDRTYHACHASLVAPGEQIFTLDMTNPDGVVEIDECADAFYANPLDGKLYIAKGPSIYEWDADPANPYTGFWRSRTYQLGSDTNFSCFRVHGDFPPRSLIPASMSRANAATLAANTALMANPDDVDGEPASGEMAVVSIAGSEIDPIALASLWSEADNIALMAHDLTDGEVGRNEINAYEIAGSAIRRVTPATDTGVVFSLLAEGESKHSKTITQSDMQRLPPGFLEGVYAVEITFRTPIYSIVVANDTAELTSDFA